MGCVASTTSEPEEVTAQQRLISDAIDRSLNQKKKAETNQIRLFLLGAGESGKSTVLKQMRLLHNNSFTQYERKRYSEVIWVDMIESMKMLILNARKFRIPLDCDQPDSPLTPYKRVIVDTKGIRDLSASESHIDDYAIGYAKRTRRDSDGIDSLPTDLLLPEPAPRPGKRLEYSRQAIADAIDQLWTNDAGIRECFNQSHKYQLELSAQYYFEIAHKLQDPNYLCTDRDILMGRIKTTGITENTFHVKNNTLKVLDAGGQRSERKKWIHFFQNIDAIVFVFAVSEYDQMLYEDGRVNRIEESLALFDALCNSPWFVNTPFILFLNKVDLLEAKLARSSFKAQFPDFDKNEVDLNQVLEFLEKKILRLNRTRKPIYVHRTCATDTAAMKFVLNAVTDMMILRNLQKSGIM